MRKITFAVLLFLCSTLFVLAKGVAAQDLVIDEQGRTYIDWNKNVLGESSEAKLTVDSRTGTSGSNTSKSANETQSREEIHTGESLKRIELEHDRIRVKIKPLELDNKEENEDVATRPAQSVDSIRVSERLKNRDVVIRKKDDGVELEQGHVRARTNFPITIGPNNELIITTPAGTKVVTILPDEAVKNLLQKGFPLATPSALPQTGKSTSSAILTAQSQEVKLEDDNGTLVYKAKAKKTAKFLGLVPVEGEVEAKVSAETGQVLELKEPWYLSTFGFLFK